DEVKEMVFTPTKPGTYVYRCGMNMFRGKFVVS
ncbi:cupredoxin domain-containing protein, partial [Candidatus Micrarchaeota archaeon]|nr:cupredoxin domain-containing protein [Candidatus Micrarchaeota archaeon]